MQHMRVLSIIGTQKIAKFGIYNFHTRRYKFNTGSPENRLKQKKPPFIFESNNRYLLISIEKTVIAKGYLKRQSNLVSNQFLF